MRLYTILLLLLVFQLLSDRSYCSTHAALINRYIPVDSLTVNNIRQTALSDPDQALAMLDEAERQKALPSFQINWTRAQIYGGFKKMERVAVKWGKLVLEDDSVRNYPQYYFNMCKNLLESMIAIGEYEEAVRYAQSMIDVLERSGKPSDGKHNAYWALARVHRAIGDPDEAYEALDTAIVLCQSALERKKEMKAPLVSDHLLLFQYYQRKTDWLAEEGRMEEALPSAQALQEVVEQLRPLKGGPYPWQLPDAVFAQKEGIAAGTLAALSEQSGQQAEGKQWFARLQANPAVDKDPELIRQVIAYHQATGNDSQVIEKARLLADPVAYQDTIQEQRREACEVLADAYQRLGQTKESSAYYRTALTLADSLQQRSHETDALELATLMETQEKERQIEKQAEGLKWYRSVIGFTSGIVVLLVAIVGLIVRYSQTVKRKNCSLVTQIDLYLSYRDELQAARERIRQLEEAAGKATEEKLAEAEAAPTPEASTEAKQKADRLIFEQLDQQVRDLQLFLQPDFTRDMLLRLTPIGKNSISLLLKTFTGENFNGYINGLRLEYSLSLLKTCGHYTIEAIAHDSGFNNLRTYQRLFREKYGMTPDEYRKTLN